jgi:hypothetical protein
MTSSAVRPGPENTTDSPERGWGTREYHLLVVISMMILQGARSGIPGNTIITAMFLSLFLIITQLSILISD